jgi:hypothetical protein
MMSLGCIIGQVRRRILFVLLDRCAMQPLLTLWRFSMLPIVFIKFKINQGTDDNVSELTTILAFKEMHHTG